MSHDPNCDRECVAGDVYQINERHGRQGWIGCFVLVTEPKSFGIQGFVAFPDEHESQAQAFIRLPWNEIDYIGHAPLTPGNLDDAED